MEYVRPAYIFRKNNCHHHVLSPNVDHWNQWECGAIREGYVRNFQKLILLLNIADQLKLSFLTLDFVPVKRIGTPAVFWDVFGFLFIYQNCQSEHHLQKLVVLLGQKFNVWFDVWFNTVFRCCFSSRFSNQRCHRSAVAGCHSDPHGVDSRGYRYFGRWKRLRLQHVDFIFQRPGPLVVGSS